MSAGPRTDDVARKPLDVGNGALCASFGSDGGWLSLGATHPVHGFVEVNGLPPFDEASRGDPAATRRYRASLSDERYAFLVLDLPPGVTAATEVVAEAAGIVQRHRLRAGNDGGYITLRFHGYLDRPALAEITEVNPPSPTGARTRLVDGGDGRLRIHADALPARAEIVVACDPPLPVVWELAQNGAELRIGWPADRAELHLEVAAGLDSALPGWKGEGEENVPIGQPSRLLVPEESRLGLRRIVGRAVAYVRGCTALRVTAEERTILTDHRLLPLAWTRDAYYQALLLLAWGRSSDLDIVEAHLRWLWLRCERPDARWMRSHHADGRRKDLAFQIDQQLYPLLELADCWRARGSLPDGVAWSPLVAAAWRAALAEVDPVISLCATTESAADDPAPLPFILSSQILMWYTARRLAELAGAGALELDGSSLDVFAARLRAAVNQHLATQDGWAYATDAAGRRIHHHDANDLPTAMAPLWGFCGVDDPMWRATMRFGLSPANSAFFAGRFPGLGSLHTPAPWPLGDIQAWLFASLVDDRAAAERSAERLCAVAFDDGMLPEAYDPESGRPIGRDWFAWPGAFLGALFILDTRGLLQERLAAGGTA